MSENQEDLDHNSSMQNLIETGDAEQVAMILGHKDRLRCGGVIRTGIQFPNSKCTPAEKAIYAEMDAQGIGYDAINRAMGGEPKTRTSKLVPKNVDYFVVRECDFTRPSDAKFIRDNFADADGKVRRFPVWFSVGEIERVIPHRFNCFSGSMLVATSFYDKNDPTLKVKCLPKDFKGYAPKREDYSNVIPVDDANPVDKFGRKLQFGGFFRFNIPGLRGFDEIIIPTRSWFGMGYSVALLRRVRSILGRFDGVLNGQHLFEMVKSPEEMTHDGKRMTQFIPVLELAGHLDPIALAQYAEPQAVVSRARNAMSALSGHRPAPAICAPVTEEAEVAPPVTSVDELLERSGDGDQQDPFFGQPDPARVRANEYLHGAAKQCRVTWPQFAAWACMEVTEGVALEDCSLEELRKVAEVVKAGLASPEREAFGAKVKEIALSFGVE